MNTAVRIVAAVGALAGCADAPLQTDVVVNEYAWCPEERPVLLVAHLHAPTECRQAFRDAAQWWRDRGVSYLVTLDDSDELPADRDPRVIQLSPEPPARTRDGGDTRVLLLDQYCIRAAVIRLDECRLQTAVHELGHALGLAHHPDPRNVMYEDSNRYIDGPWDLTPEQLFHVR